MTGQERQPRRSVEVAGLHHGGQPFPMASVVDKLVQTSAIHGMAPTDGSFGSTATEQVAQLFLNAGLVMAAAGGSLEDVVGVEVFVADDSTREIVNRHWVEVFPDPASRPARHTTTLPLRDPMLVQMRLTGVLDDGTSSDSSRGASQRLTRQSTRDHEAERQNVTSDLDRLGALDTPTVSDARDRLGLEATVATGLRRLAGGPSLSGRVVTVELVPADDASQPDLGPRRHLCTAAVDASGAGDVIVVAHGGRTAMAGWGGVLSTAASLRGIEGVIVDGAVRDVDEAIALDFPVFASSPTPVTARGRVQEREWNVPVNVAGVAVRPGDWVIADSSGVVFVEAENFDQVLTVAEEIQANERAMVGHLRSGVPVSQVMGARYETLLEDE